MKTLLNQDYRIAYHFSEGRFPCVIFCGGFHSNMQGTKALALERYCKAKGRAFIRFDYFAHGDSEGDFVDGRISTWLSDTLAVIDHIAKDDSILVGSSMGGWLALLAALQRPANVKALVLLACAVDMTQYYPQRVESLKQEIDEQGRTFYSVSNAYDDKEPYKIYDHFINDGKQHFLLDDQSKTIELDMPIHLIHGKLDDVIPWQRSQQVYDLLSPKNKSIHHLHLVEHGSHRLSRQEDIELLTSILDLCLS